MEFGLTDSDLQKINKVFETYDEIEEVILYGSRAIGNYRKGSDIDLTIIGEKVNVSILLKISTELDDLLLPYKIDLSIFHKIDNMDLIKHINRVGKLLYKKSKLVNKLIEKGLKFSPIYGNRLASHLPMALLALSNMGATEKQLNNFYDLYSLKLENYKENLNKTKINDVKDYLGDSTKLKDYIEFFDNEIKLLGREELLKKYLPVLWPGLSASAFHALIRLAYAVEAKIDSEIIVSLSYLASDYNAFNLKSEQVNLNITDLLKNINEITINYQFPKGIIIDRMNEVAKLLNNYNKSISLTETSLAEITNLCVNLYFNHQNFTVLHTITASHAIRLLLPYFKDKSNVVRYALEGVIIAFLSTGIRFNFDFEKNTNKFQEIDIEQLKFKACQSSDEHVIKFVYSCIKEYEYYNNFAYLQIAKMKVVDSFQ